MLEELRRWCEMSCRWKKRKLLFFVFVPLILSSIMDSVYATTETVYPSDDCYTDQGAASSNWNCDWLYVRDHEYLTLHSWLKFSVPSTPLGMVIESAKVYLYLYSLAFPNLTAITIHPSIDNSWSETTITWDNEPDYQAMLDNQTVYTTKAWYSWNVTDAVSSGQVESFVLVASTYYPSAKFCSKEYDGGSKSPYLYITYGRDEESVTIYNVPVVLGNKLGISTFAGGLLMSTVVLFAFLFPLVLWRKSGLIVLVVSFSVMGFMIAIEWLPYWIVLIVGLLVTVMYFDKIKKMM